MPYSWQWVAAFVLLVSVGGCVGGPSQTNDNGSPSGNDTGTPQTPPQGEPTPEPPPTDGGVGPGPVPPTYPD